MKRKNIVFKWFLSNFKLFCSSDFLFLHIYENVLKSLWKQKLMYLSDFLVTSNFFVTWIFRSYILLKFFEKFMKTENIVFKWFLSNFNVFCSSDFLFLNIRKNFLKNLWKLKILYLKQFKRFFQVIHITYITHILKLIFEACKKYFL